MIPGGQFFVVSYLPPMNAITERLDALQSTTEKLFRELGQYDDRILNTPPALEAWSALQVCHHLMLAEAGTLRYYRKKLSHNPKLSKTGWNEKLRINALKAYLAMGFKKKAPAYISGDNLPTTSTLAATAKQWRTQRTELRDYLLSLPPELHDKEIFKHPFAGRLSIAGTVTFLEAHQDRHIGQIQRTLKAVQATG